MFTAVILILFVAVASLAGLFIALFISKSKEFEATFERFKDVIDIEKERKAVEKQLKDRRTKYGKIVAECERRENQLRSKYAQKRSIYEKLVREVSILEEQTEDLSYGLYQPHFSFDTPERYRIEILNVREKQKEMIRAKIAAKCQREWEVAGSKREGKKMTDRTIKLMLRAFNNECDSAVLKVRWNNVLKMRERVTSAYEAINKLGEPVAIEISPTYLELKLSEISLTHEYQEKLQAQKEEQRRIREQMREEEKVRREVEKAIEHAMREETMYKKALEEARQEMDDAQGERLEKLKEKMALLEKQLKEAEEKGKRAESMAQKTKSGHVYIISNIGSFGEDVYKIGLTRRLEPEERVRELGDASVPFAFDIHAMIYSENAPELENRFHRHFSSKQVNLVNPRKEFFRISLGEIQECARLNRLDVELTKLAEAKEYRETIAMKSAISQKPVLEEKVREFPDSI
ncbi:MAG: DUF4041 domain-containing protein [Planctomycetota bacterium]|jgi:hypothetical protein